MGKTVDDKIVSMSFETAKFEMGVKKTISGLDRLKAALHFPNAGKGMNDISNAANKVDLSHLSSSLDKLKSNLHFPHAGDGFSEISKAAGKVDVTGTATALDKLKAALHFPGAATGFSEIQDAANKTDLSHIADGVDTIKNKFSALNATATAAIFNMTNRVINSGAAMVKKFTIQPITDGLHEYETNLNSIQTVLANTKSAGTTLTDVNKALQNLNTYSDKTIYNFSQMARNIGTFTAAGVDLDTATTSIKGIANLAAVSGSNADQAATAMYQLSQAISAGRVGLQDWNSVVNAGMGGSVFQKALVQTAQNMGTLKDSAVKLKGPMKNVSINGESFRNSIMAKPGEESWLTGDVLTRTLSQLSGDMTDAQLKAQGFTAAQIKAIQAQAKMATDAATKVKTLSQLLDTIKESIGSGWAQTWQTIFGDFGEAKHLFTGLSNTIGGFVKRSSQARNSVLKDWKKLGGRTLLINALKQTFQNLGRIIEPIKDAFRDIFPRRTGENLLSMTAAFERFSHALRPSKETVENLRRTFRGLFAMFDIGKQIVSGIFTGIKTLLGEVGKGSGGILNFTGDVGDLIVKFDAFLRSSGIITTFFRGLGRVLSTPIKLIGDLADALSSVFGSKGDAGKGIASSFDTVASSLKPSTKAIQVASTAWEGFLHILEKIGEQFKPVIQGIGDAFSNIGNTIADAISGNDFSNVFSVIQTGLVAGIFLSIKKAIGGGLSVELGTGGALAAVSKSLNTLTGSLKAMQNNIKANTMLQIAGAVTLLAAATVALSMIDPKKLSKAMGALTVSMGQLMASLFIMDKVGGKAGFVKAPLIAASLVAIAGAIDVLVLAVVALSMLSWDQLSRGLAGVTGMLAAVSVSAIPLSKSGPGMVIAGVALNGIATAMVILSGAVKVFSTMSWDELGKGLAGVVLTLDAVALSARGLARVGPGLIVGGAGMIALGVALNILAGAVKIFGTMDWGTLEKGFASIVVGLAGIGIAMQAMPVTLPITAAGLILVGIALTALSGVIAILGHMDIATLAKGIGAIGLALAVLAGGLTLMIASLPGAVALTVAAAGLAVLAPVLITLGAMKFKTIAKGLGFIALTLVSLSVVGALAAPGLLALAGALAVLGLGITLVGTGLYLVSSALVKLAGPGAKGIGVILASLTALTLAMPKMVVNFIKGLVEIVAGIAEVAPQVAVSMVKISTVILNSVIKLAPKFAEAAIALISALLKVLNSKAPEIIEAGWKLLLALLKGIKDHIVEVTNTVISIVVKFVATLTKRMPQIVAAGAKLLASLLLGIAKNLGKVVTAVGTIVVKFIQSLTKQYGKIITAGTNMIIKLIEGIGKAATRITKAAIRTVATFVSEMAKEFPKRVDQVASALIQMINDLADVIETRTPEFLSAVARLGTAFIKGFADWIRNNGAGAIKDALLSLVPKAVRGAVGKVLGKVKATVTSINDGLSDILNPKEFLIEFDSLGNTIAKAAASPTNKKAFRDLGTFLGDEFKKGLLGDLVPPEDSVDTAFKGFKEEVKSKISDIKTSIKETKKKIADIDKELAKNPMSKGTHVLKLVAQRRKLTDEVLGYYGDIKTLEDVIKLVDAGFPLPTNLPINEIEVFKQQIKQLADLNDKIDKAKELVTSLKQQYGSLPALTFTDDKGHKIDSVKRYKSDLAKRVAALKKFHKTLNALKDLGLDNVTLQLILDQGTDAQPFIDQLLKGGKASVDEINSLDGDLTKETDSFADDMAANMFNAGERVADGFIAGLEKKKSDLEDVIAKLADNFILRIKAALGIKSPSRVFAEIGKLTMMGFSKGIKDSAPEVTKTLTNVFGQISDAVSTGIDSNPTITPVLDLSNIQNGSKTIGQMLDKPISVSSARVPNVAISPGEDSATGDASAVKFVQNNYSPKALSPIDIYRQTKNQLSQAKPILSPSG